MPLINFAKRVITCKLVYYGPGLSGKTTNLEVVHKKAPEQRRGDLTTIATEGDRTLFFDYMPLNLGTVGGFKTTFQLYTVPGQAYYNATRKLVLRGADGVVFVADSQASMLEENIESFENLLDNLKLEGLRPAEMPMVIQWNKQDLPDKTPLHEMDDAINRFHCPTITATAVTGEGVFPTLKKLAELVLKKLNEDFGLKHTRRSVAKPAPKPKPEPEPEPEPPPPPPPPARELPPPSRQPRTKLPPATDRKERISGSPRVIVGSKEPPARRPWRRPLGWASFVLLLAVLAAAYGVWAGHLPGLESLIERLGSPR